MKEYTYSLPTIYQHSEQNSQYKTANTKYKYKQPTAPAAQPTQRTMQPSTQQPLYCVAMPLNPSHGHVVFMLAALVGRGLRLRLLFMPIGNKAQPREPSQHQQIMPKQTTGFCHACWVPSPI